MNNKADVYIHKTFTWKQAVRHLRECLRLDPDLKLAAQDLKMMRSVQEVILLFWKFGKVSPQIFLYVVWLDVWIPE